MYSALLEDQDPTKLGLDVDVAPFIEVDACRAAFQTFIVKIDLERYSRLAPVRKLQLAVIVWFEIVTLTITKET